MYIFQSLRLGKTNHITWSFHWKLLKQRYGFELIRNTCAHQMGAGSVLFFVKETIIIISVIGEFLFSDCLFAMTLNVPNGRRECKNKTVR